MNDDFYLPPEYLFLDDATALARIQAHRERLGQDLAIWAHAYQRASVTGLADFVGDGVALAEIAARERTSRFLICCSVRYVAENAALLGPRTARVFTPDLDAGCPMAEQAPIADLRTIVDGLRARRSGARVLPLVSVTSTLEAKAWCGDLGGASFGSSNAAPVLRWALARSDVVLMAPDRNLALSAAAEVGLSADQIAIWDLPPADVIELQGRIRLVIVNGRCPVHAQVVPARIAEARHEDPTARIVAQRDLPPDVVRSADAHGSIAELIELARRYPPGTPLLIGSEIHAVDALREALPEHPVAPLTTTFCATMYMIHPANVLYTLDRLGEHGEIGLDPELAIPARTCLERMLAIRRSS